MTRTEQAQAFASTAATGATQVERTAARDALVELKRAARVSFDRLGVTADQVAAAEAGANRADQEANSDATSTSTAVTAVTVGRRSEKREQVITLLQDVADKPRKEQVLYLQEKMGLNANAAYYFARTCQPAQ